MFTNYTLNKKMKIFLQIIYLTLNKILTYEGEFCVWLLKKKIYCFVLVTFNLKISLRFVNSMRIPRKALINTKHYFLQGSPDFSIWLAKALHSRGWDNNNYYYYTWLRERKKIINILHGMWKASGTSFLASCFLNYAHVLSYHLISII